MDQERMEADPSDPRHHDDVDEAVVKTERRHSTVLMQPQQEILGLETEDNPETLLRAQTVGEGRQAMQVVRCRFNCHPGAPRTYQQQDGYSGIRNFWLIKCQRCKEENLSQRII